MDPYRPHARVIAVVAIALAIAATASTARADERRKSGIRTFIGGLVTLGLGYAPHTAIVAVSNTPGWGFLPVAGPFATIVHFSSVDCGTDKEPLCEQGPKTMVVLAVLSFAAQAFGAAFTAWGAYRIATSKAGEPNKAKARASPMFVPLIAATPRQVLLGTVVRW